MIILRITMTATTTTYNNGKVEMADETVLSIMAINRLWIPDVLIDIIKDYLYIDANTVWRKYCKLYINHNIISMKFEWYDMYDMLGRKRMTKWTKGFPWEKGQIQSCVCVKCGETSLFHDNFNGYCEIDGDGNHEIVEEEEDEEDNVSYQNFEEEYDW